MFAVGVNSSLKDFVEAFKKPDAIAAGYVGQFIIKPLLGYLFGSISVSLFNLPNSLGDTNNSNFYSWILKSKTY